MTRDTNHGPDGAAPDEPNGGDPFTAGDAVLSRARLVARRITDRCEQLTGGTQVDHRPLPPDTTNPPPATSRAGEKGSRG
jgi:hypothetical protein